MQVIRQHPNSDDGTTPLPLAFPQPLRAFTLVELLIVVALIAIVSSLLLPVAQKATESGRRAQCVSNLRQIGAAIQLYRNEHNNYYPPANGLDNLMATIGWKGLWYAPTTPANGGLIPYVGSQAAMDKLVVCPRNRYPDSELPPIKNPIGYPYTVNYNVMVSAGAAQPANHLQFARPSTVFLMADSATGETVGTKWGLGVNSTSSGWAALENRHSGQMNILWMDGHVSTGKKEKDIQSENFKN